MYCGRLALVSTSGKRSARSGRLKGLSAGSTYRGSAGRPCSANLSAKISTFLVGFTNPRGAPRISSGSASIGAIKASLTDRRSGYHPPPPSCPPRGHGLANPAYFANAWTGWRGIPTGGMILDLQETLRDNAFARGWAIVVSHGSPWPLGSDSCRGE